jgi:hypothetical protein
VTLEQVSVWCPSQFLTSSSMQRSSQHQCAYS